MPRNAKSMINSARTGRTEPNLHLLQTGAAFKAPSIWKISSGERANSAATPSVTSLKCFLVVWEVRQAWADSAEARQEQELELAPAREHAHHAAKQIKSWHFPWTRVIAE